jgi:TetR/AcrR family transcriptional regulator, tetracycline repressor protein
VEVFEDCMLDTVQLELYTVQYMPRKRLPGQRAGLDRAEVLAAARAIVDGGGVETLSMRRLAIVLGVAPNALYSHFDDKQALLDAVLDDLLGAIPDPAPDAPWRDALVELLTASRLVVADHPALIPLFIARPGVGPNALRLGAAMQALLAKAGVTGRDADDALQILLIYTLGFAAHEAPRRVRPPARGGRHPDDATFATGLAWLIDGVVARVSSARISSARGRRSRPTGTAAPYPSRRPSGSR